VAVLSKFEPGAFIPAEIRVYGKPMALVSDKDGLPCQVTDGVDGFITGLKPEAVTHKIREILSLPVAKQHEIARTGRRLILSDYDIVKNFCSAIERLIEG